MPIPKPRKNEKQEDYMPRCIKFVKSEDPNIPNDQAVAICYTTWRNEKKKNQSVEIIINEKDGTSQDMNYNGKIKDYVYEINSLDNNNVKLQTELINGCLKAIIIESEKIVEINMNIEGIDILDIRSFQGKKYIPLKCNSYNLNLEKFNYGSEEYVLNDIINIFISGQINNKVKIKFRVE